MNRRHFLHGIALAGTAGLLGAHPASVTAEPPPETARIRLGESLSLCFAPQYVAESLLRAEGFTDVEYVKYISVPDRAKKLADGQIDLTMALSTAFVAQIDAGDPILVLSGVHVGCYELFGNEYVRKISDLKGKSIGVAEARSADVLFLSSMLAYVGLDPRKDMIWVPNPPAESMRLLADGKIDAYMAFPPEPQELRAKRVAHVIVNTALDRPWSQYFCCMLAGNREFVRKHPIATKRAVRAILKAVDLCAAEPERAARLVVDRGITPRYDYAAQALTEIPYNRWRALDPEDTLRFYALRLHEAGMVKSSPKKILAQGTDWRFLTELKKELKG